MIVSSFSKAIWIKEKKALWIFGFSYIFAKTNYYIIHGDSKSDKERPLVGPL